MRNEVYGHLAIWPFTHGADIRELVEGDSVDLRKVPFPQHMDTTMCE